jgi:hypothetical protein
MTWDEESSLLLRAIALQRAGKLPLLLADCGRLYVCDSETDPWETRRPITRERLRELVEAAEARAGWPERKPPGRETRAWDEWFARSG